MTRPRSARTDEDLAAAMAIRRAVFVEEQEIPIAEEFDARDAEATRMVLDAQLGAMPLYERSGYTAVGEDFDDGSGIMHRTMVKPLV